MVRKRKVKPKPIQVRGIYGLVKDRVAAEIAYGLRRSIKHQSMDLEKDDHFDYVHECITQAVMNGLGELLEFPTDE